jgi:ribosomal protein L28
MAKICPITGRRTRTGYKVSHASGTSLQANTPKIEDSLNP